MMEPPGGSSFPPADGEAGGPRLMLPNFLRMTVAFSVNHGAVAAMLNLSVVLLGDAGSYQSGALYLSYALTALLFSPALLSVLGARSSLLLGASLYCVYVLSFSAALITPVDMAAVRFAVALVGGVVGGFAAGFLWAAQGTYFADNAKLYAIERGIDPAEANTKLASIFAGTFLGIEVALKLLPQALTPLKGIDFRITPNGSLISAQQLVQALAYAVFAIISVFGLLSIRDLRPLLAAEAARTDPLEPPSESKRAALLGVRQPNLFAKATAAVGLWCKQPTVLLLAPIQVTFGVSASLLAYQVTSSWLVSAFGKAESLVLGSFLSALVALSAALLQLPFKWAASRCGKQPVMLLGLAAFLSLSLLVLTGPPSPDASASTWLLLLSCYLLQGVGRACYEGTNKALYADFFPRDSGAAFSNIVLANGIASATAFFTFPSLSKDAMATAALVCASVTIVSYVVAEVLHRQR